MECRAYKIWFRVYPTPVNRIADRISGVGCKVWARVALWCSKNYVGFSRVYKRDPVV